MHKKINFTIFIVYFVVFVLFWLLSHFTPVDFGDDMNYKFIFGTNQPIANISDLFVSIYNHYFVQHGRLPFVFFSQLFDGILGKNLFDICNSLVFITLIYLLLHYSGNKNNILYAIIVVFLIFIFTPTFEETHLWLIGSTDYLWAVPFITGFFMLFRKYGTQSHHIHLLWLCPYTLFTAMYHEGFSLAISFGLLVYCFLNRKTVLKSCALPIAIAFIVGTLLLVFAPGTLRRTHAENGIDLMYVLTRLAAGIYSLFLTLRIFWVTVFLLFYLYRKNPTQAKDFARYHALELSAMLISLMILFVDARYGGRINYSVEILSLLVLLRMLPLFHLERYKKKLEIAMITISFLFYLPTVVYAYENYNNTQYVLAQLERKEPVIGVKHLADENYLTRRYIRDIIRIGIESYYEAYNDEDGVMKKVAIIYDIPKVCFIPDEILTYIKTFKNSEGLIREEGWPLYLKLLSDGQKGCNVKLELDKTDLSTIPFYLKPFAHKIAKFTIEEIKPRCAVVSYHNKRYLIIDRQLPEIDCRIKGIYLE